MEKIRKKSNHIYGMMMRPCFSTVEEYEKGWMSSDYSVDKDFMKAYRDHKAAMQIVAGCAKYYILRNYERVKDWSDLEIVMEDNSDEVTCYYNFRERTSHPAARKGSDALERILDRINEENKKRHNPVLTLTECVLDPTDSDFSLKINGKHHLWISDDSVIVLAEYIESKFENDGKDTDGTAPAL